LQKPFAVTITEYLGTLRKSVLIILGGIWLIAITTGDYITHFNSLLEFSPFYLVPISFFSWFIGRNSGLVAAILSVVIGVLIRLQNVPRAVKYWDALMWSALYITATFMIVQLKRLYENERHLSRVDPLTRVANRRALFEAASRAKRLAERNWTPLSICYVDLDNFKRLNDRLGHTAGDRVLAVTAAAIAEALRPNDTVARIGGDEFAVLLPGADREDAANIMRRVERELQSAMRGRRWPVTFSMGIASFVPPLWPLSEMLAEADKAMYAAKYKRRNFPVHDGIVH
jgi:diguanylate cyclase (GGDEF)-like protein